jgi:hypothetical protein
MNVFNKDLLNTSSITGTIVGTRETAETKRDKLPLPIHHFHSLDKMLIVNLHGSRLTLNAKYMSMSKKHTATLKKLHFAYSFLPTLFLLFFLVFTETESLNP